MYVNIQLFTIHFIIFVLLQVQVFSHNNILKCNSNNWSWLSYVHLAEDCHSYNIELSENSDKSSLKIKTVRKIAQNEKLVLWFSQSVSILLQIPHLSLQNIKGKWVKSKYNL